MITKELALDAEINKRIFSDGKFELQKSEYYHADEPNQDRASSTGQWTLNTIHKQEMLAEDDVVDIDDEPSGKNAVDPEDLKRIQREEEEELLRKLVE